MKLVKNLIHIKENENYLLYCPDYNKAVIVDEELYECINNKTNLIDVNSIEKDDLEKLIRNGILYENIEVYNQGIFDKILKNRDTSEQLIQFIFMRLKDVILDVHTVIIWKI